MSEPSAPSTKPMPARMRLRAENGLPLIRHRRRAWRPGQELYAKLVSLTWPRVVLVFVALYLTVAALFARLYMLLPPGSVTNLRDGSFVDAFGFSIQTVSTIGYGTMAPVSGWAHGLVTMEALAGVLGVALTTGLVFAKFSLPRSNFLWSNHCVVTTWNGARHLMLRLVNARDSEVIEARTRLLALLSVRTPEGRDVRRVVDLQLTRTEHPLFYGGMVLFHKIDETSPLFGWTRDDWLANDVVLVATIAGIESTYAQVVHSRKSWLAEDVRFDHVFEDALHFKDDGSVEIDHGAMHSTRPEPGPGSGPEPEPEPT